MPCAGRTFCLPSVRRALVGACTREQNTKTHGEQHLRTQRLHSRQKLVLGLLGRGTGNGLGILFGLAFAAGLAASPVIGAGVHMPSRHHRSFPGRLRRSGPRGWRRRRRGCLCLRRRLRRRLGCLLLRLRRELPRPLCNGHGFRPPPCRSGLCRLLLSGPLRLRCLHDRMLPLMGRVHRVGAKGDLQELVVVVVARRALRSACSDLARPNTKSRNAASIANPLLEFSCQGKPGGALPPSIGDEKMDCNADATNAMPPRIGMVTNPKKCNAPFICLSMDGHGNLHLEMDTASAERDKLRPRRYQRRNPGWRP